MKKNKLNIAEKTAFIFIMVFCGWFVFGLAACLTVGCIFDESPVTYIVMGIYFGAFVPLFIAGYFAVKIADGKLSKSIAKNFDGLLTDMPFEEAQAALKEQGVICDKGFIINNDEVFKKPVVIPFNEVELELVNYVSEDKELCFCVVAVSEDNISVLDLNLKRELYNFIIKSGFYEKSISFKLFSENREFYVKQALEQTPYRFCNYFVSAIRKLKNKRKRND